MNRISHELLIKYRLEQWPYQFQAALAHGVSVGAWSMWESGKRKIPNWLGKKVREYMPNAKQPLQNLNK